MYGGGSLMARYFLPQDIPILLLTAVRTLSTRTININTICDTNTTIAITTNNNTTAIISRKKYARAQPS